MTRDIGIDFGTANILIHLKGRGIILNEPAVVAIDTHLNEIIAYGRPAYEMIGRTPESIKVVHPLRGGVIADFELAEAMLILFFEQIIGGGWFHRPNVLISAPSQISQVEKLSLLEAVERAGAGSIYIEEEPKVAGVGAGIDLKDPKSNMVIDIGGGTSDVAIICLGEITTSRSLKIAGEAFDQAIIQYFKSRYQLLIGPRTAEQIKIDLATAVPLVDNQLEIKPLKGRDLASGLPRSINVHANLILDAIEPQLQTIALLVQSVLEDVAPEVAADIMEQGIILTGGGALIRNLDSYLSQFLGVTVLIADQPMSCVAIGSGLMLDLLQTDQLMRTRPSRSERWRRWLRRLKRRIFG